VYAEYENSNVVGIEPPRTDEFWPEPIGDEGLARKTYTIAEY
jgi:hypothetical protein